MYIYIGPAAHAGRRDQEVARPRAVRRREERARRRGLAVLECRST